METTTLVPRDASPSCDTSVKSVQEKKLPVAETASSTPSVPTREKVGDLSRCHLHFIQVVAISFRSRDFLLQCKTLSWW